MDSSADQASFYHTYTHNASTAVTVLPLPIISSRRMRQFKENKFVPFLHHMKRCWGKLGNGAIRLKTNGTQEDNVANIVRL